MTHTNQDPQPRKSWPRRHKILTTLAALIVLGVIVSVASGGGGGNGSAQPGTSATTASPASPASPASGPGIGSKVRDGKFQFVITRVSHRTSVGDTSLGLGTKAQGRFTELHVRVTNIGSESQTLDDSSQYVFDSSGRKFTADSSADIEANSGNGGGAFLNDINPGNTVRALILFDLPKGDKAVSAELHDSMFSGGVTVSLAG